MWWSRTSETQDIQTESSVSATDLKEQVEHQQHALLQLKDLLRENEQKLKDKDKELTEQNSKVSKLKIQHKAKIAQLTSQLTEAQKRSSNATERTSEASTVNKKLEDDEETTSDGIPSHTSSEQSQRGRVLLLKKKLEESRVIYEKKEKEMQQDRQEIEKLVENLKAQLEERDQMITTLQSTSSSKGSPTVYEQEGNNNELYAQMVYKDNKIMELNQQLLQMEGRIMDLQENLREKDEVIQARNKAIQLMTEDLSRRGKTVVDQLDDTRDEMRAMQHNFAEHEALWNNERENMKTEIEITKEKFQLEISEKEKKIIELKEANGKLESARYELSTKNAALQEKVVLLQERVQQMKKETKTSSEDVQKLLEEISRLKTTVQDKDTAINSLQQVLEESNSKSDGNKSTVKIRAQYVSRIKVLEKRLKELQDSSQDESLSLLQKRIDELEEEKQILNTKLVEFEDLKTNKEKLLQETEELRLNLNKQSDELTNHIHMVSLLEKDKMDAVTALTELQKENATLKDNTTSLNTKLCELEALKKELENKNNEIFQSSHLLDNRLKDENVFTFSEDQNNDDEIKQTEIIEFSVEKMAQDLNTIVNKESLSLIEIKKEMIKSQESDFSREQANEKQEKVKKLLRNFCEKHELSTLTNNEVDNHWKNLLEEQQKFETRVKQLCEIASVANVEELHLKWEELLATLTKQENELAALAKKCKDIEEELESVNCVSKEEKEKLNQTIQNQLRINEDLEQNLDQKNEEISGLKGELHTSLKEQNCLKEELEEFQTKIDDMKINYQKLEKFDKQIKKLCEMASVANEEELHLKWEELFARNSSLEASLTRQENDLSALAKKCKDVEEQLESLNHVSKEEKEKFNEMIQNEMRINEDLKQTLDNKNGQIATLEDELQTSLKEQSSLQEELKVFQMKIDDMNSEYQKLESLKNAKVNELEKAKHELLLKDQQMKSEMHTINESLQSSFAETQNKEQLIENLKANVENLVKYQMMYEDLQNSHAVKERENLTLAETISKLEKEVIHLQSVIHEKEFTISELQNESAMLQQEMDNWKENLSISKGQLKAIIAEKDLEIKTLQDKVAEMKTLHADEKEKLLDEEKRVKLLEGELNEKTTEIASLKQNLEIKTNDLQRISVNLEDITVEADILKTSLDDKNNRIRNTEEECANLKAELEKKIDVIYNEKEALILTLQDQFNQQNTDSQEKIESLKEQCRYLENDYMEKNKSLQVKIDDLLQEEKHLLEKVSITDDLHQKITELENINSSLEVNGRKLEDEMNLLRKGNESLQNRIDQYCSEIECLKKDIADKTLMSTDTLGELEETQKKLLKVMESFEKSKEMYKILDSDFQRRSKEVEELHIVIEEKNNSLAKLQILYDEDKEALNKNAQEKLDIMKMSFDELETKFSAATLDMKTVENKLAEVLQENEFYKVELGATIEKLNALSSQLESLTAVNEELIDSERKCEEVIATLKGSLEEKESTLNLLNDEFLQNKSLLTLSEEKIVQLNNEITNMQELTANQLQDLKNQHITEMKLSEDAQVELRNQVKEFSTAIQAKESYIEQLLQDNSDKIKHITTEKDEIYAELEKMKNDYALLEKSCALLKEEKRKCDKTIEELQTKMEYLTNNLKESVDAGSDLQLKLNSITSEFEVFKKEAENNIESLKTINQALENHNKEISLMADSSKDESLNQLQKSHEEIMHLHSTIESLNKNIHLLKNEQASDQLKMTNMIDENDLLMKQVNSNIEENSKLNDALVQHQSLIADLNENLEKLKQENISLEEDLLKHKNSLHSVSTEHEMQEEKISDLIKNVMDSENFKLIISHKNPDNESSASFGLEKLKEIVHTLLLECESRRNDVTEKESRILELQNNLGLKESELTQLTSHITESNLSNKELNESINFYRDEMAAIKDNANNHLQKVHELELQVADKDTYIQKLLQDLETCHETINQAASENNKTASELQDNLRKYNEEIAALNLTLGNLTGIQKNQEIEKEQLKSQIEQLLANVRDGRKRSALLDDEIEQLHKTNELASSKLLALDKELVSLRAENIDMHSIIAKCDSIEIELSNEKEKCVKLLKLLEEMEEAKIELKEKIRDYERETNEALQKDSFEEINWIESEEVTDDLETNISMVTKIVEKLKFQLLSQNCEVGLKRDFESFLNFFAKLKTLQNQNLLELSSIKKDSARHDEIMKLFGNGWNQINNIIKKDLHLNLDVTLEIEKLNQIVDETVSKILDIKKENDELQFQNSFMTETIESLTKEKEILLQKQNNLNGPINTNPEKQFSDKRKELDVLEFFDTLDHHWGKKNTLGQGDGNENHFDTTSHSQDPITSLLQENARLKDELEDVKDKLCCLISQIETPKIKKVMPLGIAENEYKKDLGTFSRDESVPDLLANQPVTELVSEISSSYIQQLKHSEEAIMVLKNDIDIKEDMLTEIKDQFTSLQNKLTLIQQNLNLEIQAKNEYILQLDEMKLMNDNLKKSLAHLESEMLIIKNQNSFVENDKKTRSDLDTSESSETESKLELSRNIVAVDEKFQKTHNSFEKTVSHSDDSKDIEEIKEVEKLKNELAQLKIRNGKMLTKLKQFKDKNEKLQQEITDVRQQLHLQKESSSESQNSIITENSRLKVDLESLTTEVQSLHRQVTDLSYKLKEEEVVKNRLVSEVSEQFQKEITALEESVALQMKKVKEAEELNALLTAEKHKLAFAINEGKEEMELLSSDNSSYQVLVENLQLSKSKLEDDLKHHLSILYHVKEEKGKLEAENAEMQNLREKYKRLKTVEEKFHEMEENLLAAKQTIENLQQKVDHLEVSLAVLREEKIELELKLTNEEKFLKKLKVYEEEKERWEKDRLHYEAELLSLTEKGKSSQSELFNLEPSLIQKNDASTGTDEFLYKIDAVSSVNKTASMNSFEVTADKSIFHNIEEESHQRSINNRNEELKNLNEQNLDLLEKIKERTAENQQLKLRVSELLHSMQKTQTVSEEWQQERIRLQSLADRWQYAFEKSDAEYKVQVEKHVELEQNLRTEIFELMNRINELQRLLTEMQEKCDVTEVRLTQSADVVVKKENEIAVLSKELETVQIKLKMFSEEHYNCKEQIHHFQLLAMKNQSNSTDLKTTENHVLVNDSNSEIAHLKADLKQTIQSLHHRDHRCEQLTEEITRLLEERDSLQLRLSSSLKAINQKETRIQTLQQKLEDRLHDGLEHHNEVKIPLEEEHYPLMVPDTSYSLTRTVVSPTWRIRNWLLGRRNYLRRSWRSNSLYRIMYYIYILSLHLMILFFII